MVILRPADLSDSECLWEWRNNQESRAASLDTKELAWDVHSRWYESSLSNPNRLILIALNDDQARTGMVRFDFTPPTSALISINVAPAFRGHGLGQRILGAAIDLVSQERGPLHLEAQIRESNRSSIRIFEREGFVLASQREGILVFGADTGGRP